ncbi:PREDICTED: inward rectifier potassium channel 2-like [Branchiostoma belcheri]|uniref:G protein-activated inward rectifier potassium channel 3 n=1 Tax=Branchiostoma belcheri TaxID=7741 RepID=A0A6P4YVQ5_BRABE|nr:PREDICTED: inward rectifier potassium channel 2-like [Branchiostoma belcheri]
MLSDRGLVSDFLYRSPLAALRRLPKAQKKERRRFVEKDGGCNVVNSNIGEPGRYLDDIFTTVVDLGWREILLIFTCMFVLNWFVFGFLYWITAFAHGDVTFGSTATNDGGDLCFTYVNSFTTAFLFSVETQVTIGYGSRAVGDSCPAGMFVFILHNVLGLITSTWLLGMVFVKIAQGGRRAETLLFSKNAVVCLRKEKLCLMLRVGNLRHSHIFEARVRALLLKPRLTKEGEEVVVDQTEINVVHSGTDRLFVVAPVTIYHEIDQKSPLYDLSPDELAKSELELVVMFIGIVESTARLTYFMSSYTTDEVLWGHRFMECVSAQPGSYTVDYTHFHDTFPTPTPACSAREYEEKLDEQGQRRVVRFEDEIVRSRNALPLAAAATGHAS